MVRQTWNATNLSLPHYLPKNLFSNTVFFSHQIFVHNIPGSDFVDPPSQTFKFGPQKPVNSLFIETKHILELERLPFLEIIKKNNFALSLNCKSAIYTNSSKMFCFTLSEIWHCPIPQNTTKRHLTSICTKKHELQSTYQTVHMMPWPGDCPGCLFWSLSFAGGNKSWTRFYSTWRPQKTFLWNQTPCVCHTTWKLSFIKGKSQFAVWSLNTSETASVICNTGTRNTGQWCLVKWRQNKVMTSNQIQCRRFLWWVQTTVAQLLNNTQETKLNYTCLGLLFSQIPLWAIVPPTVLLPLSPSRELNFVPLDSDFLIPSLCPLEQHRSSFRSDLNFWPLIQYKKKLIPLFVLYNLALIWYINMAPACFSGVSGATKVV